MTFPSRQNNLGILEYILIIVIVILGIMILVKLFGPAISKYVEEILKNVG